MFLPQIYHIYRSKEAESLNYTYLYINILSTILGALYSSYYYVIPMLIANVAAMISSIILVHLKNKYNTQTSDTTTA